MPSLRSCFALVRRHGEPSIREHDLDGYADWVASFMSEVGITEPVLMIGHSFGGGVAIKLARNQPSLVRYLVLLNAIGCVNSRHPWDWAIGIGREFWPPSETLAMIRAMQGDLLFNFLRSPLRIGPSGSPGQTGRPAGGVGRPEATRCTGSGADQ